MVCIGNVRGGDGYFCYVKSFQMLLSIQFFMSLVLCCGVQSTTHLHAGTEDAEQLWDE
jgi:hypothetical protein